MLKEAACHCQSLQSRDTFFNLCKYGGCRSCKSLAALENRKIILDFARKHLKKTCLVSKQGSSDKCNQINLYLGTEKCGEGKKWHMIKAHHLSNKHSGGSLMTWKCTVWLSLGLGHWCLVVVVVVGWILVCLGLKWPQKILQKQTKSLSRQNNEIFHNGQVSHLISTQLNMLFTCKILKAEGPTNKPQVRAQSRWAICTVPKHISAQSPICLTGVIAMLPCSLAFKEHMHRRWMWTVHVLLEMWANDSIQSQLKKGH